jgi:iron complex outermembrane receptor protein
MKLLNYISIFCFVFFLFGGNIYSQQLPKPVSELSKEELMQLTYDNLLALPFEELMQVADKLEMSADELIEFFLNKDVTSASKRAEKSLNSPLSSTVITRDEILSSGATSIPEALRLVPGMIVREKTPGNYDVHIRGNDNIPPGSMFVYSENSISLVMIDSRPVYNYAFGGTFWETLPIEINDIDRIEVIRGPSSALYGPNAVSGAINIITLKPVDKKPHIDGSFQIGNGNSKIGSLGASIGISDKFKIRLSGNYTHFDRFEDGLYLYRKGEYYPRNQVDTMQNSYLGIGPPQDTLLVEDGLSERIPDPSLATDKYGANAFLFYEPIKNVKLSLSLGTQGSDAISTSLGNHEFPFMGRTSNSNYIDFKAEAFGFSLQANQFMGDQQFEKGNPGWHIDPVIRNFSLEYEKTLGTLVLRPGVSYQQANYDDTKYIDASKNEGFLNGNKELNAIAGFLRADYKMFDKLRLIAALRADKYNRPDKTYFTYQFIGSYDINSNNLFRAVYSRANRGPFVVDNYADYIWDIVPGFYNLNWYGNAELNLPVMDMIEIGYRTKPMKNLMLELEAFQTTTKDLSYFLPDSMKMYADFTIPMRGLSSSPVYKIDGRIQYYNFDISTVQRGLTLSASYVLNRKLNFKVFATVQQSKINDYYPKNIWNNFDALLYIDQKQVEADGYLLSVASGAQTAQLAQSAATKLELGETITPAEQAALDAYQANPGKYNAAVQAYQAFQPQQLLRINTLMQAGYKETYYAANPDMQNGEIIADSLVNVDNKATPSFYGGLTIDYKPIDKLGIFASVYFFSSHEIINNRVEMTDKLNLPKKYEIAAKAIISLKVSYKVYKENSVFINARNLLNTVSNEFAFSDPVNGIYMLGVQINF